MVAGKLFWFIFVPITLCISNALLLTASFFLRGWWEKNINMDIVERYMDLNTKFVVIWFITGAILYKLGVI